MRRALLYALLAGQVFLGACAGPPQIIRREQLENLIAKGEAALQALKDPDPTMTGRTIYGLTAAGDETGWLQIDCRLVREGQPARYQFRTEMCTLRQRPGEPPFSLHVTAETLTDIRLNLLKSTVKIRENGKLLRTITGVRHPDYLEVSEELTQGIDPADRRAPVDGIVVDQFISPYLLRLMDVTEHSPFAVRAIDTATLRHPRALLIRHFGRQEIVLEQLSLIGGQAQAPLIVHLDARREIVSMESSEPIQKAVRLSPQQAKEIKQRFPIPTERP